MICNAFCAYAVTSRYLCQQCGLVMVQAVVVMVAQVDQKGAAIATVAAILANIFESYLGASSQAKVAWMTNDAVNAIQIVVAAALAAGFQQML